MNSCDGNSFSLTIFLSFVFADYPAKNRATRFVCWVVTSVKGWSTNWNVYNFRRWCLRKDIITECFHKRVSH